MNHSTLRQATEKMDAHGYAAIPVIDEEGRYVKTISEGDLLHFIKNIHRFDIEMAEQSHIEEVPSKKEVRAIRIDETMESLLQLTLSQNFVPVVDDLQHYIGIVKRSDILAYYFKKEKEGVANG